MRPPASLVVRFDEDGTASMLYEHKEMVDKLRKTLGCSVIKRASHVLPQKAGLNFKRSMFIILRKLFGDDGHIAGWTRLWKCQWEVDFSPLGGPLLGPYTSRSEAIEVEKNWLWENCNI